MVAKPFFEQRAQLLAVGRAVVVVLESRIGGQLGRSQDLAQLPELHVVAGRHDQVAVGGGQRLVGKEAGVCVAHPERNHAAGDEGAGLVDHSRKG